MNKRSFFLRRLLFYVLVSFIPLAIVAAVLFSSLRSTHADTARRETQALLLSMQQQVEDIINTTGYQNQLLTNLPSLSSNMRRLLSQDTLSYSDNTIQRLFQNILSTSVNANADIHSVLFVFDGVESFYSTNFGVTSAAQYSDMGWLAGAAQQPEGRDVWAQLRTATAYGQNNTVLTLYQRVPNAACTIVTNIYPEKLQASMEKLETAAALFIMGGEEILLANSAGGALAESLGAGFLTGVAVPTESPVYFQGFEAAGGGYLASYFSSYLYGVTYVAVTPRAAYYQSYFTSLRTFILVVAAMLVLCVALAAYVTALNFRQIRLLSESFNPSAQARPHRLWNEYDGVFESIVQSYMQTQALEREAVQNKAKRKSLQLAMLQAQINPHFLMNTLQAIQLEARGLGPKGDGLAEVVDDLSYILRESVQDIARSITVEGELSYLRRYMKIQDFRSPGQVIVYYNYSDEVLALPFLRLVLQPLVENAIYHGLKPLERRGYIRVKIRRRGGTLHWTVTDNGVGMNAARLAALRQSLQGEDAPHSEHIGLANVNQRLVLHYGPQSALHILSHAGLGTSIRFRTPVAEN